LGQTLSPMYLSVQPPFSSHFLGLTARVIPVRSGLRVFCFLGSSPKTSWVPPRMQTLACDSQPPRSLSCPKKLGQKGVHKTLMYLNSITIVGFVGADPELRRSRGNGSKFTVLSVATQRSWKNAQDEWVSKTEWHRVAIFREHLAEYVVESLRKGSHVLVEGSLISSTYEAPNGKGKKAKAAKITSWSIRADVVRKLDRGEPEPEAAASTPASDSDDAHF